MTGTIKKIVFYILNNALIFLVLFVLASQRDNAREKNIQLVEKNKALEDNMQLFKSQADINDRALKFLRDQNAENQSFRNYIRLQTRKATAEDASFQDQLNMSLHPLLLPGGGLLGQDYSKSSHFNKGSAKAQPSLTGAH